MLAVKKKKNTGYITSYLDHAKNGCDTNYLYYNSEQVLNAIKISISKPITKIL